MPAITPATRILERDGGTIFADGIYFVQRDEETGTTTIDLELSLELDDALGNPEKLTISIEPGDRLNA